MEAASRQVGDPRVALASGPAWEADVRPGKRPPDRSVAIERCELVLPGRDDVSTERRPRRLVIAAEQPPRAVCAYRPDACIRPDEELAFDGKGEQCEAGVVDADDPSHVVDDRTSRGAESRGDNRETNGDRDDRSESAAPPNRIRHALCERREDNPRGAFLGLGRAGNLDLREVGSH